MYVIPNPCEFHLVFMGTKLVGKWHIHKKAQQAMDLVRSNGLPIHNKHCPVNLLACVLLEGLLVRTYMKVLCIIRHPFFGNYQLLIIVHHVSDLSGNKVFHFSFNPAVGSSLLVLPLLQ